jgi:dTDP-4-dehydrorhamnose 3,5-epimerase
MSEARDLSPPPLPGLTTPAEYREATVGRNHVSKQELIDGVQRTEVRHIPTRHGATTEIWRRDWATGMPEVAQVITITLEPGTVSEWNLHRSRRDGVFVIAGQLRLALYDAREASPTVGNVDVLDLSYVRPTFVLIPPDVWHAFQVVGTKPASWVNCFDVSYDHDAPDDWRLPPDTNEIPYRFS